MDKGKTDKNCWLPWIDTLQLQPEEISDGKLLVIIPSAGKDIQRLDSCVKSVAYAVKNIKFRIVVILCPKSNRKEKQLKNYFGNRVEIFGLNGKFNYCRSINYGIKKATPDERFILFLNDDVVFTKSGDLDVLVDTLLRRCWACVGPYILFNPNVHDETWPQEKSSARIERQSGEVRTDSPVSGSCALWDRKWLDRIGSMDEEFGVGWGMDEADMCLRALRSGGRYGRQDAVAIKHVMHASFGSEYTKYTGEPHMRSLNYFHKKYGHEVEEWGRSHHWLPLPGVFVILILDQDHLNIKENIARLGEALNGLRWILIVGVMCADKIDQIKQALTNSSADWFNVIPLHSEKTYSEKVKSAASGAKELHLQYPAILLVEENKMVFGEVSNILREARDKGLPLVRKDGKTLFHASLLQDLDSVLNKEK